MSNAISKKKIRSYIDGKTKQLNAAYEEIRILTEEAEREGIDAGEALQSLYIQEADLKSSIKTAIYILNWC